MGERDTESSNIGDHEKSNEEVDEADSSNKAFADVFLTELWPDIADGCHEAFHSNKLQHVQHILILLYQRYQRAHCTSESMPRTTSMVKKSTDLNQPKSALT